jgi:hypothetical protein
MLIRPFIARFQRESLEGSPTVKPNVCLSKEQRRTASVSVAANELEG